jgi:DNA-directed RNA polymerase subunit M/transcription elongation factor TFIIS
MAQQNAHPGHLPVVLGERRTLMPLKTVYELECDECDYTADEDEMEIAVFDSEEEAVVYAMDAGWVTSTGTQNGEPVKTFTCPGCHEGEI